MKKSWTLIALAAALAASGASAQTGAASGGTTAGTKIENIAEITYTPEGGTGTTTIPSNPVVTTVLPVPSFTITPNDGSSNTTTPDYTHPGQTAQVKPCDKNVSFLYTLVNTGNVQNETYTLTNTPPTGAVKTPDNIRFYPAAADTNNDGKLDANEITASSAITSLGPIAQGASAKFFQVYDIPCDAGNTDVYGADPTGTRNNQTDPTLNPTTPVPQDGNNSNTSTVDRKDGVVIGPKSDADGNGTPLTPAYNSPEGVLITPSASDTQIAQATTTTTTVTFTNTAQNTGNRPDVLNIVVDPSDIAGFPAGTTVVLLNPTTGAPLTDTNGDGKADVGVVPVGGTADVLVKVTFPAGQQPAPGTIPTVTVHVISSNDPTKSDPTKDIVNLPGLSFGDPTPGTGGDASVPATPPTGTPGNPTTPVDVTKCTGTGTLTYLPMEIANLGSAPDLYNVTGTAPITLTNGTVSNVPVVYYKDTNNNGVYDAGTDTALTDTNGDGKADTGMIPGNTEMKLIAVVNVPCAAAGQTITLNQNATSPNTGSTVDDKNDTVVVGTTGKPTVTKTVNKTSAVPGDTLVYTIIGKNESNNNVYGVQVCDSVPMNTTFVSASLSYNGLFGTTNQLMFKVDNGSWTAANGAAISLTPGTPTAKGGKLCVAVDTNGDGNITTADVMKPGDTITMIFNNKVN